MDLFKYVNTWPVHEKPVALVTANKDFGAH